LLTFDPAIVKLFTLHENMKPNAKWGMATGWLIRPDLLVTAGHCAFDWARNLGRLVQVKAYIGYYGEGSVDDPAVQFRYGSRIATTLEWLTTKGNRSFDVAFIKLNKPFEGVGCFQFADTPLSDTIDIGVVGYPGDLKDPKTKEPGAFMYEMYLPTKYNLANSEWRMLEYEIDTYGGKSLQADGRIQED
jgi:V8-like Glu-specific endopeptidase